MELAPILVLGGVVIFAGLYLWLNQRGGPPTLADDVLPALALASSGDGVLVARAHGQLVYVNDVARQWLGVGSGEPDLEIIARQAQPASSFLDLFAGEGQASFQLAERWVEASSVRIPGPGETRTVILIRELQSATTHPDSLNLSLAMGVINEIGETVNAALSVEQVLQALLTIVLKAVPADAGEICLWDAETQTLTPRGWVGDVSYVLALTEAGGVYRLGEGITGWIAQHRQPVLVTDRSDPTGVRPRLENTPFQGFVAVPLQMGERFVGTFELASLFVRQLGQADLALLQAISKPLATAIYNAELYGEQVRRLDDIARLQQVARSPRSSGDAAAVLAVLGEQVARLMSADVCGVLLYDERRQALVAEMPFYGLHSHVVQNYTVLLPEGSAAREIFSERDYWLSNELLDEPMVEPLGMTTLVHGAGLYNTALLPLQIGAERIGMLQVGNKRTHGGFTTRDLQSLGILAAQAAVVVQNVRLYQTEQQVDTELTGLQEMTHAIGALSHEGEFYADITARIARLMGIEMSGILLYDAVTNRLVSRPPFYGVDAALAAAYAIDLKAGNAFTEIWDAEDSWYSNRVPSDPVVHQAGLADSLAAMGVTRTLFAVLSVGGRRVGMVQAANKRDGSDFSERDARLLLIFATQAAAMIENARLYREMQRRADEAESVRRVAELSGAVNTSGDSLGPALAEVAGLMSSPLVFVSSLSSETGALVTEPRHTYGIELAERLSQDVYSAEAEGRVTLTRRSRLLNDLADAKTPAGYRALAEAMKLARLLAVPLLFGERVLGEVVVANRPDAYGDDDRRLLTALAVQLASALDRVRLQEATGQNLSRRLHELDAISRVSNELNLTLEYDRVIEVIHREALTATEATGCTIALLAPRADWHGDTPTLERRAGDRVPTAHLLPLEREAVRHGTEPVRVDDYVTSNFDAVPVHARSAVAAAIVFGDEPIGVLHLYHDSPQHFDAQAATFLATLAAKASLGYANAQRYRESIERSTRLRRRVEQLNQIFELGQMVSSDLSAETMLEAFAYSVQQSAGWDVVVMLLADQEAGVLRRMAHAGLPVETFEKTRSKTLPLASVARLLNDDFRISESYLLPFDKFSQWYVAGVDALGGAFEGNRSLYPGGKSDWRDGDMMLVPMYGPGGGLLGLISLDRPFNNRRPERSDVEVLEIFAHQAATTLDNIHLFAQAQQQTERLSLLNRVSLALAQSLDAEDILEISLREIAETLNADLGRAYVLERETRMARVVVDYPRGDFPPSGVIEVAAQPALRAVTRTVQPLVIDNVPEAVQTDASVAAIMTAGTQAYVALPIAVSGQTIGVFELERQSLSQPVDPDQVDLAAVIANQAAIALQNANLLEQTLVRTRELETLLEAAQATSFTLDLDEVFQNAARLTLQALDMDECAILLYVPVEDMLEVAIDLSRDDRRVNLLPSGTRQELADFPERRRTLENRHVILLHAEDPEVDPHEMAEISAVGAHTRLLVPLLARDQNMGVMTIDLRDAYRTVTHRDVRMAQALAATAATAIENARLSTETAARVEELLVINEISRAMASTMDVEAMLRTVRTYVPALTEADEIYLALYDEDAGTVRFPMDVRFGDDFERAPRLLANDELAYVIRSRQLLSLGGDYSLDEMRRMLKIETSEPNVRAYLGVPLISGESVLGVLAVLNMRSKRAFGLNDQRVLTTIASQFSASAQNARLFAQVRGFADELNQAVQVRTFELQEERDRLEALYQITSELARTLDMDRVLASALEMVAGAVHADDGVILLRDPQTRTLYNRASYLEGTSHGQAGGARHPAEQLGLWLMANPGATVIDDLHALDYWDASRPGAAEWRAALAVMLESNNEVQGAMIFLSRQARAFAAPHLRLVAAAANQVATAINNVDLYTLIREQAEHMGTLLRAEQDEAEKSTAILESIADGVVLADAQNRVILFNRAAERILGVTRHEAIGQPFSRLAGLFSGPNTAQLAALSDHQARAVEALVEQLEIGGRIVNLRLSPVRSAHQVLGTVSVFRDVTRDVEVDRMKSEFISNVSHELRTPMTSIKGYADLLLMGAGGPVPEQQRMFLNTIKTNADRLTTLVNDLLNISRLDSGGERLRLGPVDVAEVVQEAVGNLAAQARFAEKPLKLDVRIAPGLPPVQADRERLLQIIANLVDNAFNYTYAGGSITVGAVPLADKGQVQISVQDTGIGIPPAFQPRVWDRFARYEQHALVMDVAGTGLGLPIARELVTLHGGSIWFESEVDKGTIFYVALPQAGDDASVSVTGDGQAAVRE
jgi:PAS domain S-box-containing protein